MGSGCFSFFNGVKHCNKKVLIQIGCLEKIIAEIASFYVFSVIANYPIAGISTTAVSIFDYFRSKCEKFNSISRKCPLIS